MFLVSRSIECSILTCYIREKSRNIRSMSFIISLIQSSEKIIFYVKKSFTSWTNWLHRSVPSSVSILIPFRTSYFAIIFLKQHFQNSRKNPKIFLKILQLSKISRFSKIQNRFFSGALREGSLSNLDFGLDETSK